MLTRSIVVTVTQADYEPQTVRAFVHVAEPHTPEPITAVLTVADKRDALMEKALAELHAFQSKYATLSSLAEVFAAARNTRARHKARIG